MNWKARTVILSSVWLDDMRIIIIKSYERICPTRWGLHVFRNRIGKVIGFRVLGVGLAWNKPVWTCNHCGWKANKEEEIVCWKCGKGEMLFHPTLCPSCFGLNTHKLNQNNTLPSVIYSPRGSLCCEKCRRLFTPVLPPSRTDGNTH